LRINQQQSRQFFEEGNAKYILHEYPDAKVKFERAISYDSTFADCYLSICSCDLARGLLDSAKSILKIIPNSADRDKEIQGYRNSIVEKETEGKMLYGRALDYWRTGQLTKFREIRSQLLYIDRRLYNVLQDFPEQ
jgi:hypothetical protein